MEYGACTIVPLYYFVMTKNCEIAHIHKDWKTKAFLLWLVIFCLSLVMLIFFFFFYATSLATDVYGNRIDVRQISNSFDEMSNWFGSEI